MYFLLVNSITDINRCVIRELFVTTVFGILTFDRFVDRLCFVYINVPNMIYYSTKMWSLCSAAVT